MVEKSVGRGTVCVCIVLKIRVCAHVYSKDGERVGKGGSSHLILPHVHTIILL